MGNNNNNAASNGYFRRKRKNFSMVSNVAMRDDNLPLSAKGLYALIQSYLDCENFTLYKWFLQSKCMEKRCAFDNAWKALQERGYLNILKVRNPTTGRYQYVYELLDEPDAEVAAEYLKRRKKNKRKGQEENSGSPDTDFRHLDNPTLDYPTLDYSTSGKSVTNNNTEYNNTLVNNTLVSHTISEIQSRISYNDFEAMRPGSKSQLDEIVLLIQEILNTPDGQTVRINQKDMEVFYVKERFSLLNFQHIEFVLDILDSGYSEVRNAKSYVLTLLYNAPTMANNHMASRTGYDMKNSY